MNHYKLKLKTFLYSLSEISDKQKNGNWIQTFFPDDPQIPQEIEKANQLASALSKILVSPQLPENQRNEFEQKVKIDKPYFIDLFSEKTTDLSQVKIPPEVVSLFQELGKLDFPNEKEKARLLFLFLWRFFPDLFPWINQYPADFKAPNHSLYDHIVKASTLVTSISNGKVPAFFLFTISPVQEFISRARKTADLWAGSYMLSYFIFKALSVIVEKLGPDHVIFPNLSKQPFLDQWLYHQFQNSPIRNLNSSLFQKFNQWVKQWQNLESDESIVQQLLIANFPNRFLAIIPYEKDNSLPQEVENQFRKLLKKIAKNVSKELVKDVSIKINTEPIQSQIQAHLLNYFQCYWVVMPWTNDSIHFSPNDAIEDYENLISTQNEHIQLMKTLLQHPYYKNSVNAGTLYSLLLELTEKLLGARKSLRNVLREHYYISKGEKCHLCGEFEVLNLDWENIYKKKWYTLVKEGEKLCGVCITKRVFPEFIKDEFKLEEKIRFPTTSEMASIGEKRRLKSAVKEELKTKIEALLKGHKFATVPKLRSDLLSNIDGEFLMQETYRVKYLFKAFGIEIREEDYNEFTKILQNHNISPAKYYAILQMDGDNMGKWLKGEYNPRIKDTIRKGLSDALISCSDEREAIRKDKSEAIRKILCSKHPNSPSLHRVFSQRLSQFALEEVRKIVEEKHYGKLIYAGGDDVLAFLPIEEVLDCAYELQNQFKQTLSPKASMSAGILIVYHKFPLYIALQEVRNAEKIAKETFQKDAFCIRVIVHSGEKRETGGKWALVPFLQDLICKFHTNQISSTFPNEFAQIYEHEQIQEKQLLKVELKRIYSRKEVKGPAKPFLNEILAQFDNYSFDLAYFVNLLLIAKFLAKEKRI